MGAGLVVITKEYEGEEFSNTYAFENVVAGFDNELTEADLSEVGAGFPINDANTSPAGSGPLPTFLHRLVMFERLVMFSGVRYTKLYISDGKRNVADPIDVFYSTSLNFNGLYVPPSNDPIAPGSITLMLDRNPSGFSARKGRIYLRGALRENEVKFGGRDLVDFQDDAQRITVNNRVANAILDSELNSHFAGAPGDVPRMIVPRYSKPDANGSGGGILIGGIPVASITIAGPRARQVRRGRREKRT